MRYVRTVIIGSGLVVAALLIGTFTSPKNALGSIDEEYTGQIQGKLKAATEYREEARRLSCTYIGELTRACYSGTLSSCTKLNEEEMAFQGRFGHESYISCFEQEVEGELPLYDPYSSGM